MVVYFTKEIKVKKMEILVEKYRPQKVDEICGQEHIITDLKSIIKKRSFDHLLFFGRPGVGKTTAAHAISKELMGKTFEVNFTELNASDERGINTVREKIKHISKSMPIMKEFRIILLDEIDSMTKDGQHALRRIMEKYSSNCRFILCCNEISKIINALKSRCVNYKFLPLKDEDIKNRLEYICKKEEFQYNEEGLNYISSNCDGDIRQAIMRLQSVANNGTVTMDNIYQDTFEGTFLFIVKSIFKDKNWLASRKGIKQYIMEGGDCRFLLVKMYNYVIKNKLITIEKLGKLSILFREADRDLLEGVTEQLVIDSTLFKTIEHLGNI